MIVIITIPVILYSDYPETVAVAEKHHPCLWVTIPPRILRKTMGANNSQTATPSSIDTVSERGGDFHRLTGFQRDLLVALADFDKPSGQTIKHSLEDRTGKDITHGRLYPNLDTLVKDEFVEKGQVDRRTNYYAISETGQEALTQYIEWVRTHAEG